MAEYFASLRQETQIVRQGIVNTLTGFALEYYDRQTTSAKYLVDSLIPIIFVSPSPASCRLPWKSMVERKQQKLIGSGKASSVIT
ncbi:MAG: hypothetical protein QGI94_11650 [Candidatus Scalindua sp.]|nr:hypothetical protein [Candidatus Scalindua sp.]